MKIFQSLSVDREYKIKLNYITLFFFFFLFLLKFSYLLKSKNNKKGKKTN